MRVIIAGSRSITDPALLDWVIQQSGFEVTEILEGEAPGVDRMAKWWGKARGIPVLERPADWDRYGKRAGHIRNEAMGQEGEALIALWDGVSPGTKDMIDIARRLGLPSFVYKAPTLIEQQFQIL